MHRFMEQDLISFADALLPSDKYIDYGTKLCEKVLAALKAQSQFGIDRILYTGSIEKSIEITTPDFDLVLFITDVGPPFDKVLEEWEQILILDKSLGVDPESVQLSEISLQFTLREENGDKIEVDLLPASNLVEKQKGVGGRELAEAQKIAVLRLMNKKNYLGYSSSLSESQVYFMKDQNPLVYQVVRLAKFWYKSLYLGENPIYKIKSMLELIAVSAAMMETKQEVGKRSVLRAFKNCLDDVSNIDKLKLGFEKDAGGNWVVQKSGVHTTDPFYIMEPYNKYNNLVQNLKNHDQETIKRLKTFANVTWERIQSGISGHNYDTRQFSIHAIFEPQPTGFLPNAFPTIPKPRIRVHIGLPFRSFCPFENIQSDKIFEKIPSIPPFLEAAKKYFSSAVTSAAHSVPRDESYFKNVKDELKRTIGFDFFGFPWIWLDIDETFEDYDVAFTFPMKNKQGDEGVGIMVSFRWD